MRNQGQKTCRYFGVVLLFVFAACGRKDSDGGGGSGGGANVACADFSGCVDAAPLAIHPAMAVRAFPSLESRVPELQADFNKLATNGSIYPFDISGNPSNASKYFDEAFGGLSAFSVKNYLEARVKYLIPESVDPFSISYTTRLTYNGATTASVLASNSGTLLWFLHLSLGTPVYTFIGNERVVAASSRMGVIQLGSSFWNYGNQNGNSTRVSVGRLATLVHEGRHSDCTNGFSQSVLDQFRAPANKDSSDPLAVIVNNSLCGNLHTTCPSNHPVTELRGKAACDTNPWGAYAMETIFTQAVATQCTNCDSIEKQVALISAMDSRSRLMPLSNDNSVDHYNRMISGDFGVPDMNSSGVVYP